MNQKTQEKKKKIIMLPLKKPKFRICQALLTQIAWISCHRCFFVCFFCLFFQIDCISLSWTEISFRVQGELAWKGSSVVFGDTAQCTRLATEGVRLNQRASLTKKRIESETSLLRWEHLTLQQRGLMRVGFQVFQMDLWIYCYFP